MRYVRAVPRIVLFCLVTGVLYAFMLVTSWLLALSGASTMHWRARMFRFWARIVARIINLRIEIIGSIPSAPFFLVSNHLSYVDVVLFASRLDCVFVAKADVRNWPVFGVMCRSLNTIFIDRASKRDIPKTIERIQGAMALVPGVVVFPEGTSSGGSDVLRFRPALLEAAARAGIPVSYASLSYSTSPGGGSARNDVCWWGGMGFPGHLLKLFQLPEVHATLEFGKESVRHEDRKVLASLLWEAVRRQFRPVVG